MRWGKHVHEWRTVRCPLPMSAPPGDHWVPTEQRCDCGETRTTDAKWVVA